MEKGTPHNLALISALLPALDRARPSNRRLGQQIADEGQITFTSAHGAVVAAVQGPPGTNRRRVTFTLCGEDSHWSCTCTSQPSPECKHVIAAVIAATRQPQP